MIVLKKSIFSEAVAFTFLGYSRFINDDLNLRFEHLVLALKHAKLDSVMIINKGYHFNDSCFFLASFFFIFNNIVISRNTFKYIHICCSLFRLLYDDIDMIYPLFFIYTAQF